MARNRLRNSMSRAIYAIPGLMPPTSPNVSARVITPENGGLFLCVHCGRAGDVVNFAIRRVGWCGGTIKDPSYDFGPLEDNAGFVARKAHWAQFLIQSTVLPEGADILMRLVHIDVPVRVTERPDIKPEDRVYWLLELPAGTLPVGQSELDIVVNGKVSRYTLSRPEFVIHSGYAANYNSKELHQLGETLDIMVAAGKEQRVIIGLGPKWTSHVMALPPHTEFRARIATQSDEYTVTCQRNGGELSMTVPALPEGRMLWRCEYRTSANWIQLCSGDMIATEEPGDKAYKELSPVGKYLYEVTYDTLDYAAAKAWYNKRRPQVSGGCTSARCGNIIGRNFDWLYSESASFIIHAPGIIGMSGATDSLSEAFMQAGKYSSDFSVLPFRLVDGMNQHGLVVSSHVVPSGDKGDNTIVTPMAAVEEELCSSMLPMVLLDRFSTASAAAEWVRDHVRVFNYAPLRGDGYELHLLLADRSTTLLLEFIDGRTEIIDISANPCVTNFHLHGVTWNADGTVMTPATGNAHEENSVTPYGAGLERYNYAVLTHATGSTPALMLDTMSKLWYSRTYPTSVSPADPRRDTEFVGGKLTVASQSSAFDAAFAVAGAAWDNRDRAHPEVWHTVHTSVYDLDALTMKLVAQEDDSAVYTRKL